MSKKYTVVELKKICKTKGISGYSKMKKEELIKHCVKKQKVIMSKKYTVVQLRKICKDKGIKGYSKMRKGDLMKHCLEEKKKIYTKIKNTFKRNTRNI